jgi:hypothetical protein
MKFELNIVNWQTISTIATFFTAILAILLPIIRDRKRNKYDAQEIRILIIPILLKIYHVLSLKLNKSNSNWRNLFDDEYLFKIGIDENDEKFWQNFSDIFKNEFEIIVNMAYQFHKLPNDEKNILWNIIDIINRVGIKMFGINDEIANDLLSNLSKIITKYENNKMMPPNLS